MLRKKFCLYALLIAMLVSGCTSAQRLIPAEPVSQPITMPAAGTVEVAFSPKGGCTEAIIKALDQAKTSIKVQAYSFTSTPIAKALAEAQKRGVEVRVILDKSQDSERYTVATFLNNQGIPVHIDRAFQIAHSKIMIVDDATVITGSFNFTKSAEEKNAENVLILRGNSELARVYCQNWQWRWQHTEEYQKNTKEKQQ